MTNQVNKEISDLLEEKGCHIPYPTTAEVVMWLYEKWDIWIEVSLMDNSRTYHFDYTIINSKARDFNDEDCFDSAKRVSTNEKFNTPKNTYEAAIKQVLKDLKSQL